MQKYQEVYIQMIDENKELFDMFFRIHDLYVLDPKTNQEKFNEIGKQVQEIIHSYERRLCGKTESGMYSKFSAGLSEKFWGLVRADFPKIDFIGVRNA
jgi:hypothetical protein